MRPLYRVLDARRKELGLTVYQVAHDPRLSCGPDAVYRFLSGKTELRSTALGELMSVLQLELRPRPGT